jgi:PAS domain S-box-containing protein
VTPEQFLEVTGILPEPMCLVSVDGRLLAANLALGALLGWTIESLREKALADLATDSPEKIKDYLRACSASRELVSGSLALRSSNGVEFRCRSEGALVQPRSGDSPALITLRFRTEESDSSQVLLLNQKIEELAREIRERRRAEDELRATEHRFTMFMENLPGLAWIKDLAGRYVYANDAAVKAFQTPRAELYGRTDEEIFPPLTAAQFKENDRLALSNGTCVQTIETLEQTDGTHHSIVSKFPIISPGGQAVMVGGVAIDITEHKRREEAFQKSESRYRALFETTQDGIMIVDDEGRYVEVNESLCRILKAPRERLVGAHFSEFIPPVVLNEAKKDFAELKTFSTFEGEFPLMTADGQVVELDWISRGNFVPGLHFCVAREITERKRAQAEIEQSEEKYRSLLENANDIIYSHDLQGNYLTINRACEEVTGYTRKEILGGLNISQVVVPEHRELAREMTMRKLTDPSPTVYEVDIFTKDRRRLTLEVSTRIAFRNGQPVAVEGIGRDVTERKRIERAREELLEREQQARLELEEASRMKDEFLATVSHELRTPLTAMLGWSHLLRSGKLDEASTTHAIETIERNARSQAQLIEDLLDVSRIITGNLRLDVRPVNPNGVIEGALEAVRPAAEAKGVRLVKVLDTSIDSVFGDPTRLQQVVWNLLSNAIKFTPLGGQVSIRLERVGAYVEMLVTDTGEGINQDFLPYVFDRFRQADAKTTRRHGGLGLGLAIVRHLVEMHGGTVRAESPGQDQGATFRVRLPLMPVYQSSTTQEANAHAAGGHNFLPLECPERLDGLKVLAVDDEADTREVIRAVFEQCGAKVTTASSAAEALVLLEETVPDVLISDIGMPDEDGYELIAKVRALPAERGGKIPAVALTAYARAEDRLRALRTGYQMHVPKPVELAELVAIVARLTER